MRRVARAGALPDARRRPARLSRRRGERRRRSGDPFSVAGRVGSRQRGESRIRPGRQPGSRSRAGRRAPVPESDTRAEGDPFTAIAHGLDARPEAAALAPRLLDFDDPVAPGTAQIGGLFPLPAWRTSSRFNCGGFRVSLPTPASSCWWTPSCRTIRGDAARATRTATGTARSRSNKLPPRPWRFAEAHSNRSTASTRGSCPPGSRTWTSAPVFRAREASSTGRRPDSATAEASPPGRWVTLASCRSITATPFAIAAFITASRPVFSTGPSSSPGCSCASSSFPRVLPSRAPGGSRPRLSRHPRPRSWRRPASITNHQSQITNPHD